MKWLITIESNHNVDFCAIYLKYSHFVSKINQNSGNAIFHYGIRFHLVSKKALFLAAKYNQLDTFVQLKKCKVALPLPGSKIAKYAVRNNNLEMLVWPKNMVIMWDLNNIIMFLRISLRDLHTIGN